MDSLEGATWKEILRPRRGFGLVKSYSLTDKGMVRSANQDFFFSCDAALGNLPNFHVVADGMGGHNAGEFASSFAVESLTSYIETNHSFEVSDILLDATAKANEDLFKIASTDPEKSGCGTTVVEAVVENGILTVLNIGDSRLYLISKNGIKQITEDHSMVEEMVRLGVLTHEEAQHHPEKHKITRAFGIEPSVKADIFEERVFEGDVIIMCSDGLSNMISDEVIFTIVKEEVNVEKIAKRAVEMANLAGGTDNITITVIRV